MRKFNVKVNGKTYQVEVDECETSGSGIKIAAPNTQSIPAPAAQPAPQTPVATAPAGGTPVSSPMPGVILSVAVKSGQSVSAGDTLLVIEAMKMENPITAPKDGVVTVAVNQGASVATGDLLVTIS